MKNTLINSLAILTIILASSVISFAQNAKRIDLAKEGPAIIWEERVSANSSKNFVFYLKKGQKVKIGYIEDTRQGTIDFGKYSIEEGFDNALEMDVEVSKDYNLTVFNPGNKATSFRISISLENAAVSTKTTSGNSNNSNLPNTERVTFAKGSIEANLERTVAANNAKRFVFWAKEGQEISFTVTPARKGAGLSIDFFDNEVKAGELFTMEATKTGDYTIQILNVDNKDQAFTLDLGIAGADRTADTSTNTSSTSNNSPNGIRVQFSKGETSAMVTRDIPANGTVDFVVNVKKGQTLEYTVGYDFKDSDIEAFLTEPGMQDISLSSGPKSRNEFVIKKSGDQRITVNNTTGKKITMTLYVDVN